MSRKTQYRAMENEYFHICNRGVRKSALFHTRANYLCFLSKVSNAFIPSGISIICLCLMPNHFHFVIQQLAQDGISHFMSKVCNGYAKAINKQLGTTGHVFESKYKIIHVESENYLLWISKYVHRNPREAHLVEHCKDWEYSSFRDYVGQTKHRFVNGDVILSQFRSPAEYAAYVEDDTQKGPGAAEKCTILE